MAETSAHDTTHHAKRTEQLLKSVEQFEREQAQRNVRVGRFGRWSARVSAFLTFSLVAVLLADGWIAYRVFTADGDASDSASRQAAERGYEELEISRAEDGRFVGQVTLVNPSKRDLRVWVTVNLYDGEQEVGEVSGFATLKPESESVAELVGYDDFVDYTESRVHLTDFPT